jgi:bifunctional non-homologous end joining protein LigD
VPTLAKVPPADDAWLHEIKFDGFRAQVHVEGGDVTIYSRKGADMTKRFRRLKNAIVAMPVESAIIDCELVALNSCASKQCPQDPSALRPFRL